MREDIDSLLDRVATEAPDPLAFIDPRSVPEPHFRRPHSHREPSVRTRLGAVLVALAVTCAGTFFALRAFDGVGKRGATSPTRIPKRTPTSFSPGRLAYETSQGLFTINPDGSDVQQISSLPGRSQPSWSPDGQLLAFSSSETDVPGGEIFVMNADGSAVRMLTHPDILAPGIEGNAGGTFDYLPLWSPDGTQVAFIRSGDGRQRIGLVNADGSGQRFVSNGSSLLAWTPDGLLEVADPVSGVMLLDPATGTTAAFPLAAEMGCPTDAHADGVTFSADGSVAMCWSDEPKSRPWTLTVMHLADRSVKTYQLDVGAAGFSDGVWRPAIAPDGSAVVFESFHSNDDLWRLGLTGSSQGLVTAITHTAQNEGWPVWAVSLSRPQQGAVNGWMISIAIDPTHTEGLGFSVGSAGAGSGLGWVEHGFTITNLRRRTIHLTSDAARGSSFLGSHRALIAADWASGCNSSRIRVDLGGGCPLSPLTSAVRSGASISHDITLFRGLPSMGPLRAGTYVFRQPVGYRVQGSRELHSLIVHIRYTIVRAAPPRGVHHDPPGIKNDGENLPFFRVNNRWDGQTLDGWMTLYAGAPVDSPTEGAVQVFLDGEPSGVPVMAANMGPLTIESVEGTTVMLADDAGHTVTFEIGSRAFT